MNRQSEAQLDLRRAILRARGVPEAFIENIISRNDTFLAWRYLPLVIFFVGVAISVIAYGFIAGWHNTTVHTPGLMHLKARGAILASFAHWQMFGILPVFLGLMLLPLCVFQFLIGIPRPYPGADVTACWLRTMQPLEEKAGGVWSLPERIIREAKSAEHLLRLLSRSSLRKMLALTLPLFVIGGVAYSVLGHQYWAIMPDRVVARGIGDERIYLLQHARSVSIGCNHANRDYLEYKLNFVGKSFDLPSTDQTLSNQDLFSRIELVDAQIRALNVPRQRWQWFGRDPMAPACLDYWSEEIRPNGKARVLRLLSAP